MATRIMMESKFRSVYTEQNFDFIFFLVAMATERKKTKINTKKYSPSKLLARFICNIIRIISVIWGANDTKQNFDFIIYLVVMATKRKKL